MQSVEIDMNKITLPVKPTPEQIMRFTDIICHYACVKGIIPPKIGFGFIEMYCQGINPFKDSQLLKLVLTGVKTEGLGKRYLSSEFVDPDQVDQIWGEMYES